MTPTKWTGLPKEREPRKIAELNDWLRANLSAPGQNRVMMTQGVAQLIGDTRLFLGFHRRAELLRLVRDYDDFSPANDPHREHDMGVFEFEGTRCIWKIDYFDQSLTMGAEDPADAFKTVRVLTILRGDEW